MKITRVELLQDKILEGIKKNLGISYFTKLFEEYSKSRKFPCVDLKNDNFSRSRRYVDGSLFSHIDELKYPPKHLAKKGRLNDNGQQIAYLSAGIITNIVELNLGFYEIFCNIDIKCIDKSTIFFCAGITDDTYINMMNSPSDEDLALCKFLSSLLTKKDISCYNATIALSNFLLRSKILGLDNEPLTQSMGLIYNSARQHKMSCNGYNLAVTPDVFDRCMVIESATYHFLSYDSNGSAILQTLNEGKPREDGSMAWELTHDEMINNIDARFSAHIYQEDNRIVHYKYGFGDIIDTRLSYYTVKFKTAIIDVPFKNIAGTVINLGN